MDEPLTAPDICLTFKLWASPAVLAIGGLGNVLTMVILMKSPQDSDTSFFVWIIAFSDLLVLMLGLFPEWLEDLEIVNMLQIHPWSCKMSKFLKYTSMDFAIWLMVCFTMERFVSICFPLRKKIICPVSKVKIYFVCLFTLIVLKNSPVFWTRGKQWSIDNGTYVLLSNCGVTSEASETYELYIRPWLVFVVSNLIPLIILLFCNGMVILTLHRRKHNMSILGITITNNSHNGLGNSVNKGIISDNNLHSNSTGKLGNYVPRTIERLYHQVTVMCHVVSLAFIICIIPSVVLLIGKPYWDTEQSSTPYIIAKVINNQLVYVNHSVNFYLYLIIGIKFRTQCVRLLTCDRVRLDEDLTGSDKAYSAALSSSMPSTESRGARLVSYH